MMRQAVSAVSERFVLARFGRIHSPGPTSPSSSSHSPASPFTGGFFGKFYVFSAAIHSGLVWLAILGLFNSGIAAFYYLRLLTRAYSKPSETLPMESMARVNRRG